jgi:hypothetical protein
LGGAVSIRTSSSVSKLIRPVISVNGKVDVAVAKMPHLWVVKNLVIWLALSVVLLS